MSEEVPWSSRDIFVFGSNREGRHGKGAALYAKENFGAKYGQAEGLQGRSYAIITKELRRTHPPVKLDEVKEGVKNFLSFARNKKHWRFILSPIGCGLAGFKPNEIAPLFKDAPKNVVLPKEFKRKPAGACCNNERRNMNGGCDNCGDPCL